MNSPLSLQIVTSSYSKRITENMSRLQQKLCKRVGMYFSDEKLTAQLDTQHILDETAIKVGNDVKVRSGKEIVTGKISFLHGKLFFYLFLGKKVCFTAFVKIPCTYDSK